jgi:hypothetical protein
MGQLGFFDLNRRYECLIERNDPLVAIGAMVPFESFRPKLHAALIKGELRRSEGVSHGSARRRGYFLAEPGRLLKKTLKGRENLESFAGSVPSLILASPPT